jgi:D-sedoheptulose 7-phosphate isomerase
MEPDRKWYYDRARRHLSESAELQKKMIENCLEEIVQAASTIAGSLKSGGKVLLCGNGGSAADCQHMAAEFANRLSKKTDRPGLKAIALTTDSSFLTGYSNDFGFDGVFSRQVETWGEPGDVLIGISTSGKSRNILKAMEASHLLGMKTIALTGAEGPLMGTAQLSIAVPGSSTQYIQECHLAVEHVILDLVECTLCGKEDS